MTPDLLAPKPDFEQKIGYKLHKLTMLMNKLADHMLQEQLGITFSQFLVLKMVSKLDAPSQRDVASCLDVTPAAISRHIDTLKEHKLISRRHKPHNRREHGLVLTPEGTAKAAAALKLLDSKLNGWLDTLGSKESAQFRKSMDKLTEGLQGMYTKQQEKKEQ